MSKVLCAISGDDVSPLVDGGSQMDEPSAVVSSSLLCVLLLLRSLFLFLFVCFFTIFIQPETLNRVLEPRRQAWKRLGL